jgi:hypothetical protein
MAVRPQATFSWSNPREERHALERAPRRVLSLLYLVHKVNYCGHVARGCMNHLVIAKPMHVESSALCAVASSLDGPAVFLHLTKRLTQRRRERRVIREQVDAVSEPAPATADLRPGGRSRVLNRRFVGISADSSCTSAVSAPLREPFAYCFSRRNSRIGVYDARRACL